MVTTPGQMRARAASVALAVSILSACATPEQEVEPTADPTPITSPTATVAEDWSDDPQTDLLRVFDQTMAAADATGYTETWTFPDGPPIVRVLDPHALGGARAAQKIGNEAAVRIDRDGLLGSYLGEWVLKHTVAPGTVRDGDRFTTTVDNPTVTVMVVETTGGVISEVRDYFGDLGAPVTTIRIDYTVTSVGRQVLDSVSE